MISTQSSPPRAWSADGSCGRIHRKRSPDGFLLRRTSPLLADFVVEVGLEGRVGWADDFLRSRQGQRFAPAPYGAAALMHWKL